MMSKIINVYLRRCAGGRVGRGELVEKDITSWGGNRYLQVRDGKQSPLAMEDVVNVTEIRILVGLRQHRRTGNDR